MKRLSSLRCLALMTLLIGFGMVGCQSPFSSTTPPTTDDAVSEGAQPSKVLTRVTGGGRYLLLGSLDTQFSVSAVDHGNGNVSGSFHETLVFGGLLIDIHGTVTCLTVDAENGRAWIGGVVTENNSEHPGFLEDIHQPGAEVWFRVLDTGQGSSEPDRLTFLGFEGGGGIITSEEYCEAAIWPDENARTHPVTSGMITVTP